MGATCDVSARFWKKVADTRDPWGCWEWVGAKTPKGYGWFGLTHRKSVMAHRMSYSLFHGSIPDNKIVLHLCDNPGCVNPVHLELGTHLDNARDRDSKRRNCYGARHHNVKLTDQDVITIRCRWQNGDSCPAIAKGYGVARRTVWAIATGRERTGVVNDGESR